MLGQCRAELVGIKQRFAGALHMKVGHRKESGMMTRVLV